MCGRYVRRADKQAMVEFFGLQSVPGFPVAPEFNIAPTTHQVVVRQSRETGGREAVLMRWGLVPFQARSIEEFKGISTINARAESLGGGMWKRLFERQRCLVPAEAFYEWETLRVAAQGRARKDRVVKKPWAFGMKQEPLFAFAGLWDAWKDPLSGEWLQSFAIVTTEANELLARIHTRMPVILEPEQYERWLDRGAGAELPKDLLQSFAAERMQAWAANPKVNNARNQGEELLVGEERLDPEEDAEAPWSDAGAPGESGLLF
ncbi:MAG: SOS response-associated peptidase [Acidobacteriaceae bacterium]|nr:SOS response-associated peptidase [Acidobacteriaceae bacterium]